MCPKLPMGWQAGHRAHMDLSEGGWVTDPEEHRPESGGTESGAELARGTGSTVLTSTSRHQQGHTGSTAKPSLGRHRPPRIPATSSRSALEAHSPLMSVTWSSTDVSSLGKQ